MQNYRPPQFNILPEVTKNLLIINGLLYVASLVLATRGIDLWQMLGIHYWDSEAFQPYQMVTHIFMHADLMHLFFNMFTLWMFGSTLENYWGWKRFFIFYFFTGLGAAFLHQGVNTFQIFQLFGTIQPDIGQVMHLEKSAIIYLTTTVGASGAVYGLLMAFGMLFPNSLIYLYFFFPIKAKYLVMLLIAFELFTGFANFQGDNIAHFAHLGGMLFGFVLLKYWQRSRSNFY